MGGIYDGAKSGVYRAGHATGLINKPKTLSRFEKVQKFVKENPGKTALGATAATAAVAGTAYGIYKYFKSPSTSTPEEEDDTKKEDEVRNDDATEMLQRQADGTMKSVAARTVKIIGEDGSVKTVKAFDTLPPKHRRKKAGTSST